MADSDAILKARGKATYDDLIVSTFEPLRKPAAGLDRAWKILDLAAERACSPTVKVGASYPDREVRVLGRVVAWRDIKGRDGKPGKVTLFIEPTRKAALKRADEAVKDTYEKKPVVWGTRPEPGELPDIAAHRAERTKIWKAGDVAKLKAYRDRYRDAVILMSMPRLGMEHQWGNEVWDASDMLMEASASSNEPKLIELLLAEKPKSYAIDAAAMSALTSGQSKLVPLLLPLVSDPNEESFGHTLLAHATRLKDEKAIDLLLAKGADPNHLTDTAIIRNDLAKLFKIAPKDGNGPMVNAVRNGDVATLEKLMKKGGDPMGKTGSGRRVVDLALELGNKKVLALLGVAKGKAPTMDMKAAIANDNVARVLELVEKEGTDEPLAACGGDGLKAHTEILRALLASKAKKDPKILAKALNYSAGNGLEANVALLLEHGADPNYDAPIFGTARSSAKGSGHTKIAAMLAKAGGKLRV